MSTEHTENTESAENTEVSDAIATVTCVAVSFIIAVFLWIELSGALKPPIA